MPDPNPTKFALNLAGERIVVTGGGGFLGRNLLKRLVSAGADPEKLHVPHAEDFDLSSEADVVRMYSEMQPSVVFHLAAEVGGIGANEENPGRFFYSNMAMGLHLIEHARINNLKKFIQIGTICAYPKFTPVPFQESQLWEGYPEETNAPYGVAKKALLVMLQAYRKQYQLNGIYLLPVNLYGPGDNFNPDSSHVIPALIRKFVEARDRGEPTVEVWGTGTASREFLFVDDCARGIVQAAQHYDAGAPVNLGAGFEITIRDLVEKLRAMTGFEGEIVWDSSRPDGQPRRRLDVSAARELFGFQAEVDFDEGLKMTVDWWSNSRSTPES